MREMSRWYVPRFYWFDDTISVYPDLCRCYLASKIDSNAHEIIIYRRFSNFQTTTIEFTWPFTRSPSGVGGYRRDCRVSGLDGLDDSKSILSRLGSSRGPRTVNDPYTPSPCCETNHPPWLYSFFRQQLLNRITLRDSTRLAIRTTASLVSRGCARERRLFRGISRITESLVASDPIDRIWFPYRTIRSVTRIAYIPGRIQTCHVSRTISVDPFDEEHAYGKFYFWKSYSYPSL